MTRKSADKIYDHRTAFNSAEAFYGLAQQYIEKIQPDIPNAYERAIKDVGGLVASVTTLTLALELYIKVLRILCRIPIVATHHLLELYGELPDEIKGKIENSYEARIKAIRDIAPGHAAAELQIAIHVGPPPLVNKHEEADDDSSEDKDLKSVLRRASDAFLTWRYLHEMGQSGKWIYLRYEFSYLQVAADSMRAVIRSNTNYSRDALSG